MFSRKEKVMIMKTTSSMVAIVAILAIIAMVLVVVEKPAISGQATKPFCYENDGGFNPHRVGRITTSQKELVFDKCLDSKTLSEKFCTEEGIQTKTVDCIAEGYRVCESGACYY